MAKRNIAFSGIDISKRSYHVNCQDSKGKVVQSRHGSYEDTIGFYSTCVRHTVFIETCAMAHNLARTLIGMGHNAKLIPPHLVKPFLAGKTKTDAHDAQAICTCGRQPQTTFVAVKSEEQQTHDHITDRRRALVEMRTKLANQTRAFLAEHGYIYPQGITGFIASIPGILSEHADDMPALLTRTVQENYDDLKRFDRRIEEMDKEIEALSKMLPLAQLAKEMPGIGWLTAFVMVCCIGDGKQFNNGRQLAQYLGFTPHEHSTGGRQHLGSITKRGNIQVRTLLFMAARCWILSLGRRKRNPDGTPVIAYTYRELWALKLVGTKGLAKASIALANHMCRMLWAMFTKEQRFDKAKAPHPAKAASAA
jgi:transposase